MKGLTERLLNFFIFLRMMKKKIYVVDDTLLVRKIAIGFYECGGYEARGFPDAGSLLEAIARGERPDLILMDTKMPGIMGYEACERLKRDEATSGIKIIGASGADADSYERRWREAGADYFTPKPFSLGTLLDKTRELLEE